MARDALAVQALAAHGGSLADATFNAVTASNGSYFLNDGNVVLLCKNASGGASRTITVTSVADEWGRTGDVELTVADGDIGVIGRFRPNLFNQIGAGDLGKVFVDYDDDTGLTIAAVSLQL